MRDGAEARRRDRGVGVSKEGPPAGERCLRTPKPEVGMPLMQRSVSSTTVTFFSLPLEDAIGALADRDSERTEGVQSLLCVAH